MAENLNTGKMVHSSGGEFTTRDNNSIEKLCYDNDSLNCDIYGGMYTWAEMMNYAPADNEGMRITRGICPEGWHIPTRQEWTELSDYLGDGAGGMLKDTSLLWRGNNTVSTNETGFAALPAGGYSALGFNKLDEFLYVNERTFYWTTYKAIDYNGVDDAGYVYQLTFYDTRLLETTILYHDLYPDAYSVRCVKDP